MLLTITVMLLTGCGTISVIGSTTSLAVSNNLYAKTWSSADLTTYLITEKDIKTHVYDTITTVEKKVDETFIISKPKESDIKILTVKVEESKLFKPDDSIILASTSSPKVEDKICNVNEWYILSFLILLGSLVYLFIYNKKPKLKIRKRKRKTKKKKIKKKKRNNA